jgi:hypothetical protein
MILLSKSPDFRERGPDHVFPGGVPGPGCPIIQKQAGRQNPPVCRCAENLTTLIEYQ